MAENGQTRTARRNNQKKQKAKRPLLKKILLTLLIILLVLGIGTTAVVSYWVITAPPLDHSQLEESFASTLLDANGEEFASLGQARDPVHYEELPPVLTDAVLATEDARFFSHPGVDAIRVGGAALANVTQGFGAQGASTITMQLVQHAFLSPEQSMKIKVQEAWLALQLERHYSKEEILEMYLNKIYYGAGAYGVSQAAETYFGKEDLSELTLPEAAILAGLPQRPSAYNPFENPELTKERMNTVLSLMVQHGYIDEATAQEANQVNITDLLVEPQQNQETRHQAFIQQVATEVEQKLGADIFTDGLTIHTTLDPNAQETVESLLTDSAGNPIPYPDDEMQAGMTVLDTATGAIQAIGGSRNSEGNYGYNYATQGSYQLGSVAKPIMSFGPAIEHHQMSTYYQLYDDGEYEVQGTDPIRNWDRQPHGWLSAREALSESYNVPTAMIMEETGLGNAKDFAESIGIEFANDQIDIRDSIGGTATEATPLEVAGAYRAFGNQGLYNEPFSVTQVDYPDGRTVDLTPEPEAVMSDYTAYMVTDMLQTAITEGTGTTANVPGLPVAGKTGTTNLLGQSGSPDSWFAGYTTNYTIAAWAGGYSDEEGNRSVIPEGSTDIPQHLFRHTMEGLSQGMETPDFEMPESVVEVPIAGTNELFVRGTGPEGNASDDTTENDDEDSNNEENSGLDPVSDLTADYNASDNIIQVDWSYDSAEDVTFDVAASINGGDMQPLSSTEGTSLEITEVEEDAEYVIQVIARSNNEPTSSDEASVSVTTGEGGEQEESDEIPPVSRLSAEYDTGNSVIDVSWNYDGPPSTFEVYVNGQTQMTGSNGIEISGASPGETYTVNVTPITENGDRGQTRSTSVTVSDTEGENTDEPDTNGENEEDQGPQPPEESDTDESSEEETEQPEDQETDETPELPEQEEGNVETQQAEDEQ